MALLMHKKIVLTIKENYLTFEDLKNGSNRKSIPEKYRIPQNTLT